MPLFPTAAFFPSGTGALATAPEPEAIRVRTPNWLGDVVVSTGFVAALLDRFPRARVDLIVRAGFEALPLPQRGRILPFDRKSASPGRFGKGLRGAGYSHLFVLPPSFSSAWMAWSTGAPWRIGYGGEGRSPLLRPALKPVHLPRSVHLLQEYLDLLAPWTLKDGAPPGDSFNAIDGAPRAADWPPRLAVTPAWLQANAPADPPWRGHPVVLAPGAEYGPAKQWPAAHYARLAQALSADGWEVVVVGLPKDRGLGDAILKGVRAGFNLCGETTLTQLTALLSGAALLVSNDSGAMHLAAALGTAQIALFGSTNPAWTGPINPRASVLTRREWCSPCYDRACRFRHTRCLAELAPGGVIEEAQRLLLAAPKGARPG